MHWLDNAPTWLSGLVIIGAFLALSAAANWLARRFLPPHQANNLVSDTIRSVVAFYAILIGLIAVTAWTNYRAIEAAVDQEARTAWELYDQFDTYPQPERAQLQATLRAYVQSVVEEEWPAQLADRRDPVARPLLTRLRVEIVALAPAATAEPRASLYRETRARFAALADARHARRLGLDTALEPIMWFVVLAGSVATIVLAALYHHESWRLQHALAMILAGVIGLLVFWLVSLDYPLCGGIGVSPERFRQLLEGPMAVVPGPQ